MLHPHRSSLLTALAAMLLGLSLAACASSRDASAADERVERQLAALDEAVDLTDAQAERVRAILVASEADRPSSPPRGGRGGQGGPPPGGDRGAHQAEVDRQIEALLTDDQVARYREWRASQPRPERPPRRGR